MPHSRDRRLGSGGRRQRGNLRLQSPCPQEINAPGVKGEKYVIRDQNQAVVGTVQHLEARAAIAGVRPASVHQAPMLLLLGRRGGAGLADATTLAAFLQRQLELLDAQVVSGAATLARGRADGPEPLQSFGPSWCRKRMAALLASASAPAGGADQPVPAVTGLFGQPAEVDESSGEDGTHSQQRHHMKHAHWHTREHGHEHREEHGREHERSHEHREHREEHEHWHEHERRTHGQGHDEEGREEHWRHHHRHHCWMRRFWRFWHRRHWHSREHDWPHHHEHHHPWGPHPWGPHRPWGPHPPFHPHWPHPPFGPHGRHDPHHRPHPPFGPHGPHHGCHGHHGRQGEGGLAQSDPLADMVAAAGAARGAQGPVLIGEQPRAAAAWTAVQSTAQPVPPGADPIDWRVWDETGGLNWGLVVFAGLAAACGVVWLSLFAHVFRFCRG